MATPATALGATTPSSCRTTFANAIPPPVRGLGGGGRRRPSFRARRPSSVFHHFNVAAITPCSLAKASAETPLDSHAATSSLHFLALILVLIARQHDARPA